MKSRHGSESGLFVAIQLKNVGPMWSHDIVDAYHHQVYGNCGRNTLVSCAEVHECFYFIYTEFPLLETSGWKDMAVPNQVSNLTLPIVIHVSAMPNRDFFLERNGGPPEEGKR